MYSLVLMTVMAGSGDTASFGRTFGGCHGSCTGVSVVVRSCHGGCNGVAVSSCTGCQGSSCFGSCTGSSCSGSCHCTRRPLFHRGSSCHGSSCHGCTGSSCHGSVASGCNGCFGTGTVIHEAAPTVIMPAAPAAAMPAGAPPAGTPAKSTRANITVELPAAAKLTVDGVVVAGEGTARLFHTPELALGQTYFYDMAIEIDFNGKPSTISRRVVITAGQSVTVNLEAATSVAAK